MVEFFRRALVKLDKLDTQQRRDLLLSAVEKIKLLVTVLDSIDVGILVCDENNKLVMINKFAQRMLLINYTEGTLLWSAIKDIKIAEIFKNILINRERVLDREIDILQQGRKRLLSINVGPLVQDRRITGTLIYVKDITEKRRGETSLRRAENLASLTTVAAGVAHEIKNPLASISIHLQLLQKAMVKNKSFDKKTGEYFDVLNEEIDRLNRTVVDFLFAVRPMALELRKGDVNKLILQVIEFASHEMEQTKIHCRLELEENLPEILMDERLLKQALLNFATNAKAAMPNGGQLTVTTHLVDNEIKIQVSDTGMGISEENITKIFEPYFTTKETGTGLGLTLAYKIIREHQGEITVHSVSGEGAGFEISLPVPQKETRMIAYHNEKDSKE